MEELKKIKDPGNGRGTDSGQQNLLESESSAVSSGDTGSTIRTGRTSGTEKSEYYRNKPLNLSKNAIKVLEKRYLKRDEDGVLLETPNEMFLRVARNISTAERYYGRSDEEIKEVERQFFDLMSDLDFLPNSPTLMNAGKELQQRELFVPERHQANPFRLVVFRAGFAFDGHSIDGFNEVVVKGF